MTTIDTISYKPLKVNQMFEILTSNQLRSIKGGMTDKGQIDDVFCDGSEEEAKRVLGDLYIDPNADVE